MMRCRLTLVRPPWYSLLKILTDMQVTGWGLESLFLSLPITWRLLRFPGSRLVRVQRIRLLVGERIYD
jgi:hypothetical protein